MEAAALVPATATGEGRGREVAGVELGALFRRAVTHLHGGERGAWMTQEAVEEIARVASPAVEYGQTAAFVVATSLYEPTTDRRDPARSQAVAFLRERLGVSRRSAYYACEQVDLVQVLKIDRTGVPSIRHLNEVVWSQVGRAGWGKVNAWVVRKGGFEKVSPTAVADYCQQVREDEVAEQHERSLQATAGDPHDPGDVEVVDAEPAGSVPAAERRERALQATPAREGPPWANAIVCESAFDTLGEIVFDLARGTDAVIEETCVRHEDARLRAMIVAAMIELGRPPERIAPYLTCPRSALVRGLKGIAAMERERVGVG